MNRNVNDILHSEEQLRNTLHSDDKDKLRRKLVQLQREYLRTAQRLKRAERLEAVRRHVKSRISQQNHQDQRNPEDTSDPCLSSSKLTLITSSGNVDLPQQQEHTKGPADCETSRRSQVIRFMLPLDTACPQTSDPSHDLSRSHKHSPALRLRSQRSRLRWERRSTDTSRNNNDNNQTGQEQNERLQSAWTAEEKTAESKVGDAVNASEELFSGTESESPSLLLTHWNSQGHNEIGDTEGKECQKLHKLRGKETHLEVEKNSYKHALTTEEREQNVSQNSKKVEDAASTGGHEEERAYKENSNENTEQNEVKPIENEKNYDNVVEMKERKSGITGDKKAASLLDSCTLVEGLLYPAEYYVRTTRRMTFSQSQPDMQAVILSQLSVGRHRRGRGRSRGPSRDTLSSSDLHTRTDLSSLTTASTFQGPPYQSHVQAPSASAEPSQGSCEISDPNSDFCSSPTATATHPPRGRGKRRGRGRGRSQTRQSPLNLDPHQLDCKQAPGEPRATITPVSSSQSLAKADGVSPCLNPHEAVPEPDKSQLASTHSPDSQPSSEVNGTPPSSAYGHLEKVYPIFLKNRTKTNHLPQMNRGPTSWTSLLLPTSSSPHASLLPISSLSSGSLVSSLKNLDFYQDFHLPDDQFASLKLHKLHEVASETRLEHFSTPPHITRGSIQHSSPRYSSSVSLTPLPLPFSFTPTITNSPHPYKDEKAATPLHKNFQNLSTEHMSPDKLSCRFLTEELPGQNISECDVQQHTENLHTDTHSSSAECVSNVQQFTKDCAGEHREDETVTSHSNSKSSISAYSTHRPLNFIDSPQPHQQDADNSADRPVCRVNDGQLDELKGEQPPTEEQTDYCSAVHCLQDQISVKPREECRDSESPSFDYSQKETPEEPSNNCVALQAHHDTKAQAESAVHALNLHDNSENLTEPSQPDTKLSADRLIENKTTSQSHHSQFLLCSPLASAPCRFLTPHLPSSTLTHSPVLPSLGLTPHPVAGTLPVTFSPSAPSLSLPPPHSPSTQALSPPALSPCPSITSLPPSLPPLSPSSQLQASSEPPAMNNQCQVAEPASCPAPSSIHFKKPAEQVDLTADKSEEKSTVRHNHTLKAAAGGFLVDACCLSGPGGLCVAAAGKWAVCLWSQTSSSDWSLTHTWTFSEPVINVFPVPDAAGMMCVTLGKLEIREVRMLSCSSLMQMLVCEGVIQVVVGMSRSRVVTSYHSVTGSSLQVFTLSDSSSAPSSQTLMSPGVSVGALAPVDGLSDALIGTDEGGHVFIWNLKTGQLLCRVLLGHGLSHTACLRGYSCSGVLLVLLQHQFLNSVEEEEEGKMKDLMFSEEEMKITLFSLVGINPLSGKSVLVTRLYPPKAWSGRLCEADVNHSSVVGLSQSGCACVWELGQRGTPKMVLPPEGEVWQLARWGEGDTLVIGHHNGDVSLLCNIISGATL